MAMTAMDSTRSRIVLDGQVEAVHRRTSGETSTLTGERLEAVVARATAGRPGRSILVKRCSSSGLPAGVRSTSVRPSGMSPAMSSTTTSRPAAGRRASGPGPHGVGARPRLGDTQPPPPDRVEHDRRYDHAVCTAPRVVPPRESASQKLRHILLAVEPRNSVSQDTSAPTRRDGGIVSSADVFCDADSWVLELRRWT